MALALVAPFSLVVAACSVGGDTSRPSPESDAEGRPAQTEGSDAGSQADERARTTLLADVRDLTSATGSVAAGGPGAAVVAAITQVLADQASALAPRSEPRSPEPPPPATGAEQPAGPERLVTMLAAASTAATSVLPEVGAPMARLVAALAAGHAVAATTLARAAGLGAPSGVEPALVDATGTRTGGVAPVAQPVPSAVASLSTALDVEAQARYAYGVAAVHLAGEDLAVALALRDVHDDAVGALAGALEPTAPESASPPRDAYRLPFPITDGASAATLGADVEDGCADAWADVVAGAAPGARTGAASRLVARAQQGAQWRYRLGQGASLVPLPGLSGRT